MLSVWKWKDPKYFPLLLAVKNNSCSWNEISPARIIVLSASVVCFIVRRELLFICHRIGIWCHQLQLGIRHTTHCTAVEFIIKQATSPSSRALDQLTSWGPFQLNLFYDSIFTICFSNCLQKYRAFWKVQPSTSFHGLSKNQKDNVSSHTVIQTTN